tara:strand:+ start:2380 stop:2646 length:267 start_codon:yes stop_codon:yes gene_type:complete
MIKVRVDKIWLGKVSIRDFIYKKALRKKESIGIEHGNEYMFIPYEKLKSASQYTRNKFRSKFTGKDYKLIDFDWKPFKPEDKNQGKLL